MTKVIKEEDSTKSLLIMITLLGTIVAATLYFSGTETEEIVDLNKLYCGDYRCGEGENCLNCPKDCKCGYNEECVDGECIKKPVKPYCGDYRCGEGENCLNCPKDCKCGYNEECVDGECGKSTAPRTHDVGYDACNNGVGGSEPESAARRCGWPPGKTDYVRDCCCCYLKSHIHDLGDVFKANSGIEIEYKPGLSKGCKSTMQVSYSVDGDKWNLFHTTNVVQETWSPKTTYNKTLTVPKDFRYIKIHIPGCFNDYSSARVIDNS